MHEAAGDARDEEAVVDLQFYGVLEGLLGYAEHAVELLGLGYCAGEAVEDESGGGVVLACLSNCVEEGTHPLEHSALFSSSVLIMLIMISSLTRPPASMIFFASRPSAVFAATCARSMSPVACNLSVPNPFTHWFSKTYKMASAELLLDLGRLSTLA